MLLSLVFALQAQAAVFKINDNDPKNEAIENIIVLMMENRSFDTFLGRLLLDGHNKDVNGVSDKFVNHIPDGPDIATRKIDSKFKYLQFNPGHELPSVTEQIYGLYNGTVEGLEPNMAGFAINAVREAQLARSSLPNCFSQVFGLHGADTLPITYALANEFAVVDEWYASVPGPTYPNRHFLNCATSLGKTSNNINYVTGLNCKTYFKSLNDQSISWRIYSDGLLSSIDLYTDFRNPLMALNIKGFGQFKEDARNGKLPKYSYVDPNFQENDNHPPHDIINGEKFLKEVYENLRASSQWESSLLVVTYDEHGGFYDHVKPPYLNIPAPDMSVPNPAVGDFNFDRLGVRVPTLLISPWIPKGGVFRSGVPGRYFEHSSIAATLKVKFDLYSYLTKRDAWALSFHSVTNYVDEVRKDCLMTLGSYLPVSS